MSVLAPALVAVMAGGCGYVFGLEPPVAADAPGIDVPDPDAAQLDALILGPWGLPSVVFEPLGLEDDDPTLPADMLELYFNRDADIYVATRSTMGTSWSTPTKVVELSSTGSEVTPEILADGLTIYFGSNRGASQGHDIWIATRSSRTTPWNQPERVAELATSGQDVPGGGSSDQLRLSVMRDSTETGYDMFETSRTTATLPWSPPMALTALNTTANEASAFITPDGLELYFDSDRNGADGSNDLFLARRSTSSAPFLQQEPIVELSSPSNDTDPWVSTDGRYMIFASNRDGGLSRMYETKR